MCNEDLSLKNIEFLQKYNITLVINLVKSDEIYLNKMETFIKLLQNYGVKYVLYKRVNVERLELKKYCKKCGKHTLHKETK